MKKLRLLMAFCALFLIGGGNFASAQWTDVTSTYLSNAGFDDCTAESSDVAAKTIKDYSSNGWSNAGTGGYTTVAVTAYGGGKKVGDSTTPSTKKDGTTVSGNTLGIIAGWGDDVKIQSADITLPAGVYVLIVDHYLPSSTTNYISSSSRFGFVTGSTSYLVASTSFTASTWTTETVLFTLSESTTGKIQVGLKGNNASGSGSPAVFYDDIKLLKADYPATPIANNTTDLYFKNETTGQFLSAGQSWGTHATVDNYGQEITATVSEGIYSLKTQQYNAYLNNLYMDNGTSTPSWLFLETSSGSGKYYMTQDGGINYLTSNGAGAELVNVTSPTDASIWTIVSKADRKTAALSSATINTPSDVTFLIADANFNRKAISSVWNGTSKTSDDKTNLNLAGGANDNMCAESLHATFSISQTLSGLSDGVYGLTAQGFYRQDGSDNEHLPYFYLGEEKATFPVKTGSENDMSSASTSFSAGLYTIDPIYVRVEGGSVELGAKLTDANYNLWCIWDNFQLKYYGDVTVAAVKMKASVDAYNAAMAEATAFTEISMFATDWTALQTAITANTVNLNDPALTEETLTTATSNLVAANTAATLAVNSKTTYDNAVSTINGGTNVSLTSLIVNPSFESDFTGWTNTGNMVTQTNSSFDKTGSKYVEFWQPNGTKGVSQTVGALPAGIYTLQLRAKARGVTSAKMFANTNEQAITIEDNENEYSLTFEIADKASINIGFEGVGTGAANSWLAIDNFRLTYVGTINDLTYTKATGKMGTDKSEAQNDAEATFLANKTLANYNALIAAIAEAEASVANYAKLKAAIDKAKAVKTANNFVTADATTTFESAISTATNGWTDCTFTDAQATEQVTTLGTGVSGWHANATGAAGVYVASAWGKTNENWWEAPYINTWSTEGDNDGSGFSVPFFEYYADNNQNLPAKTMTASLTGLENGVYEVELWARVQRRSDADFNGDNSMITMNVNGGDAVSIMSDTEHTVGTGTGVMRLGRYTATGIVTDGTLTLSIDVKLGANVHWLCWRDVTYTKVAPATVSKTITAAGWATYCSPYALDLANATGLTDAYIVTGATGTTLNTTSVKGGTVPPNTGILIKAPEGTVTIPVVASSKTNVSGNKFQGVTEATEIAAEAGYVLMADPSLGFYKNANAFTVGANTAYLPANFAEVTGGARSAYFFGGNITGVENVEAAAEAKAKEGKFIENGKLVIVKNGVKYNAAGAKLY